VNHKNHPQSKRHCYEAVLISFSGPGLQPNRFFTNEKP